MLKTTKQRTRKTFQFLMRRYGRHVVRSNGFWFIDIPRTSSTSIRFELAQAFGSTYGKRNVDQTSYRTRQIFPDHRTAAQMTELLGNDIWEALYKFSVVRNPFARIVSTYHYRRAKGQIGDMSFQDYVLLLQAATNRSRYFSFQGYRYGMSDYITGADGKFDLDFVAKYENRKADLAHIGVRIGLPSLGQAWIQNATPEGQHYSDFYNPTTRNIVENLYRKDLELFEYEFENG